jgi:hypothetical protein
MQDWLLQIMQLIQYPHVSLFSTVITNEFIYGAKFIYNKDQHANTCVSVWGRFPVGKIWSSHSTIKSRFDKAITKQVSIKLFGTPSSSFSAQIKMEIYYHQI